MTIAATFIHNDDDDDDDDGECTLTSTGDIAGITSQVSRLIFPMDVRTIKQMSPNVKRNFARIMNAYTAHTCTYVGVVTSKI